MCSVRDVSFFEESNLILDQLLVEQLRQVGHIVGQVVKFRIELFDDLQAFSHAHPTLSLHKLVKSFFLSVNLLHIT